MHPGPWQQEGGLGCPPESCLSLGACIPKKAPLDRLFFPAQPQSAYADLFVLSFFPVVHPGTAKRRPQGKTLAGPESPCYCSSGPCPLQATQLLCILNSKGREHPWHSGGCSNGYPPLAGVLRCISAPQSFSSAVPRGSSWCPDPLGRAQIGLRTAHWCCGSSLYSPPTQGKKQPRLCSLSRPQWPSLVQSLSLPAWMVQTPPPPPVSLLCTHPLLLSSVAWLFPFLGPCGLLTSLAPQGL